MPSLESFSRIAILVGERGKWPAELAEAVEAFCAAWDAVVISSHASNYKGDYGYNPDLINGMRDYTAATEKAELVIYIGGVPRYGSGMREKEMWRVNPDGEIRDFAKTLTRVFQMDEAAFFRLCVEGKEPLKEPGYARKWQEEREAILARADFDAMPFCNVWVARELSMMLPEGSVFHLSGSNTARCWNFFQIPRSVACHSNDGTWGIDGQVSAFIGECLASPDKLHFCAAGDLTFFYDMNSIGNRHIGANARLLLVNNGGGGEMKLYSHHPASAFGEDGNTFMAALGHYGNKSRELVRHYAEDLGFEYLTASDKQGFLEAAKRFTATEMTERPMLFEVFTDMEAESAGIYMMNHLVSNIKRLGNLKRLAANVIRSVAGQKGVDAVKRILKR